MLYLCHIERQNLPSREKLPLVWIDVVWVSELEYPYKSSVSLCFLEDIEGHRISSITFCYWQLCLVKAAPGELVSFSCIK